MVLWTRYHAVPNFTPVISVKRRIVRSRHLQIHVSYGPYVLLLLHIIYYHKVAVMLLVREQFVIFTKSVSRVWFQVCIFKAYELNHAMF